MPIKVYLFLLTYAVICHAQAQRSAGSTTLAHAMAGPSASKTSSISGMGASRWTAGGGSFSAGEKGAWSPRGGFTPAGTWTGGATGFADRSQPGGIWRTATNFSSGTPANTLGVAGASAKSGASFRLSSQNGIRGGFGTHSYSSRGSAFRSSPLRRSFSARGASGRRVASRSPLAGPSARGAALGTGSESPAGFDSNLASQLGPGHSGMNGSRSNPVPGISGSNLDSDGLPSLKEQLGGSTK